MRNLVLSETSGVQTAAAADDKSLAQTGPRCGGCSETAEADQSEEDRGRPPPIRGQHYSASTILAAGGGTRRGLEDVDFKIIVKTCNH